MEANHFADILRLRSQKTPNALAFVFLNDEGNELQRWTYAELDRQARYVASLLKNAGERILLLHPPGPSFVAALFGCFYAGRVAVPTFPPTSKRVIPRLQHIAEDANINTVLTTTQIAEDFSNKYSSLSEFSTSALNWITTDAQSVSKPYPESIIDINDLAILQYTSGSTRDPLGTMITHKNLIVNSAIIAKAFRHNTESIGVIWLPPYHDMGLIGGILQPVYVGFPCVLMPPMTIMMRPIRWLEAISNYRATTSGGPNFAYDLCFRRISIEDCSGLDLSSWRVAFNGAEPINAHTLDLFARKFSAFGFQKHAFLPCYGLAEATLCATYDESPNRPNILPIDENSLASDKILIKDKGISIVSCGTTDSEHQCHIVDPVTGEKKAPGQIGEIWLSGPSIATGYWNRPALTQETFQAKLSGHAGFFLRTGDLGALINDSLFVLGRIKDVMIIRGKKYHPHDIEASIIASLKNIETSSTAVFSIPAEEGERLVVVQETRVPAHGQDSHDKIIQSIRRAVFSREQLQVGAVILVKRRAIPKTFSGKIQRALCRRMYLNGELSILRQWSVDNVESNTEGLMCTA